MNHNELKTEKLKILVVDDHQIVLGGMLSILRENYSRAEIFSVQTAEETIRLLSTEYVDVAIIDLSIPYELGIPAQIQTGIHLLKLLMSTYPYLNIMVQSSSIESLLRIEHDIENHQGGFTIADKSLLVKEMIKRLDWALSGITYTKELKRYLEVKPEWLELLRLAFNEGLQDKVIAQKMYKSERMIRHYWTKIQNALEIYPEEGRNIRAFTLMRAREEGLID